MKIVKSFEESGLLIKLLAKTIVNEAKERKGRFFSMLLGKLCVSLLENFFSRSRKAELELVKKQ